MEYRDIAEPDFINAYNLSAPATMTSVERMYALHNAVRYTIKAGIPGDFIECGVWKGGSVMMIAATLRSMGVTDRDIYLFDTFQGMTPPTDLDIDRDGRAVADRLAAADTSEHIWAIAPLEEVRANLENTGYPMERFKFVKGDVMQTLPSQAPEKIALLRLDTDWYESTKQELETLFPRLVQRGVLIIDDYGAYKGSRKATDDYFATLKESYILNRIDPSGRLLIKA